jgi:hypothetical protein
MRILPYRDPKINGFETIDACVVYRNPIGWCHFLLGEFDAEGIAVGVDFYLCRVFFWICCSCVRVQTHVRVFIESSTGAKLAFDMRLWSKKGKFDGLNRIW